MKKDYLNILNYKVALNVTALICLAVSLTSCSMSGNNNKPERKQYYTTISRQLAPEPVYNRIRYARPPEPLPKLDPAVEAYLAKKAKERPRIYLGLKNASIEELAKNLSEPYKYQYYVSSKLSKKKVTFNGSGNIDELANSVQAENKFNVIVDHENKEVRIMPTEEPSTTKKASITSTTIKNASKKKTYTKNKASENLFGDVETESNMRKYDDNSINVGSNFEPLEK